MVSCFGVSFVNGNVVSNRHFPLLQSTLSPYLLPIISNRLPAKTYTKSTGNFHYAPRTHMISESFNAPNDQIAYIEDLSCKVVAKEINRKLE